MDLEEKKEGENWGTNRGDGDDWQIQFIRARMKARKIGRRRIFARRRIRRSGFVGIFRA